VPVLAPLAVAVPILVAAALGAVTRYLRRTIADAVAIATASVVVVFCVGLLVRSMHGTIPYWFGGWRPSVGPPVGIAFAVDPIGAGLATFVAVLVTAALVHSWRFLETVGTLFHVLVLVFLGAMVGFALTGDLFNLFVFFELMGVCAYALTGYKIEEEGPLQGALNLAVTNTIGGFFILIGVGLLYARTGTLNMAAAGHILDHATPDGLVVVSFVLILLGLITKGAIAPFHFWLADAHAVAPAPVCALFSGVMVELGLYGLARIYWTVFSGPFGADTTAIRATLLGAGVLTAAVGAVMSLAQRHLKRLLAFSTVAHEGVFLIGIALLTPEALGGVATAVGAHALVKASLFFCVGILLHRKGTVDEHELHGAGRRLRGTGLTFIVGALALAGLPPFATALGEGSISGAATDSGFGWVPVILAAVSILTAGAVLRAGAGIFGGWGQRRETSPPISRGILRETEGPLQRTPATMILPACVLLGAALVLALVPAVARGVERAAEDFLNRAAYADVVLLRTHGARPVPAAGSGAWWNASELVEGTVTSIGAIVVALLGVFGRRLTSEATERATRPARSVVSVVRSFHNGHVGDYVTWMGIGAVVLGGVLVWSYR
jgi:multicomponent Na+:H+ antiporter subunit D